MPALKRLLYKTGLLRGSNAAPRIPKGCLDKVMPPLATPPHTCWPESRGPTEPVQYTESSLKEPSSSPVLATADDLRVMLRSRLRDAVRLHDLHMSEQVQCHLLELLSRCALGKPPEVQGNTLAESLLLARELTEPRERFAALRAVGNRALFLGGCCFDALQRRGIARDYVATMGARAFSTAQSLSGFGAAHFLGSRAALSELAEHITPVMDVLETVTGGASGRGAPSEIVRVYERWQRTGSRAAVLQLHRWGVSPTRSSFQGEPD